MNKQQTQEYSKVIAGAEGYDRSDYGQLIDVDDDTIRAAQSMTPAEYDEVVAHMGISDKCNLEAFKSEFLSTDWISKKHDIID